MFALARSEVATYVVKLTQELADILGMTPQEVQ
jgi:hypothetical protein